MRLRKAKVRGAKENVLEESLNSNSNRKELRAPFRKKTYSTVRRLQLSYTRESIR